MRIKFAVFVGLFTLFSIAGLATTPGPCSGVCEIFEAIVEKASAQPDVRNDALMLFAMLAEGRPVEIPEAVEARLGLPPINFLSVPFSRRHNRAQACGYIGKLATKEAIAYLELLSTGNFKSDDVSEIWPVCRVGLAEARMRNLPTREERVRFLEVELRSEHDAWSRPLVGHWLMNQLCDTGNIASLPAIVTYVRQWQGKSPTSDSEIAFCRQRMEVIASNPDRVQAIASVLKLSGIEKETRLYGWAIHSLMEIGSTEAIGALDRFTALVEALPQRHASREFLSGRASYIRDLRASRRPMKLQ